MAKLKPVPSAAPPEAPAVKKKSKKLLYMAVAVLVLGGAGGGAWYWLHQAPPGAPKHVETKAPVFVTLEPFTVNLQAEGGDHYLQVGIVYQVSADKTVDAMKTYMPIIRNRILLLLSAKLPSELTQVDGKKKLVTELVLVARESLPEGTTPERGITGALLSSFVIQ